MKLGQFNVLDWQRIITFWLMRDAWCQVIGCDFLAEDKCVIINTRGLVDANSESNDISVDLQVNARDQSYVYAKEGDKYIDR